MTYLEHVSIADLERGAPIMDPGASACGQLKGFEGLFDVNDLLTMSLNRFGS